MHPFRYAQFCPLARAAEILGHRGVLPILRELFVGPQRFSDLRRRLAGVSSSLLADRLALVETHGVVARRALPPPAASTVYELTERGSALEPTLVELARWGLRFLGPPRPEDHIEPDWFPIALLAFAHRGPCPARRFELRLHGPASDATARVAGGPQGAHPIDDDGPVDLRIEAPVPLILGLASGLLSPADARTHQAVRLEGDPRALADFSALFDMNPKPNGDPSQSGVHP